MWTTSFPGAAGKPAPPRCSRVELDLGGLVWAGFSLFAGGFVKGIVGIGLPLVSMPLLTFGFELKTSVALMVAPMVTTNLFQAFQGGMFPAALRRFWPLLLTLLFCVAGSTKLLVVLPQQVLYVVIGLAVIVIPTIAHLFPKLRIPPAAEAWTGPLAGTVSGLLGGISGFYGPLLIVYLVWLRLAKDFFVAAVSLMFFIGATSLGIGLVGFGIADAGELLASAAVCLPCFLGLWLGQKLRVGLDEKRFARLLLLVYLVTGGSFLLKAI